MQYKSKYYLFNHDAYKLVCFENYFLSKKAISNNVMQVVNYINVI